MENFENFMKSVKNDPTLGIPLESSDDGINLESVEALVKRVNMFIEGDEMSETRQDLRAEISDKLVHLREAQNSNIYSNVDQTEALRTIIVQLTDLGAKLNTH